MVVMALPGSDTVHKVSIIPRGIGALGYTIQRPTEDRFLMSKPELEHKITVCSAAGLRRCWCLASCPPEPLTIWSRRPTSRTT